MSTPKGTVVTLRPWQRGDLPLLRRLMGDREMTRYLGGPETEEQLVKRHERYLTLDPEKGRMFVITSGADASAAGSIGYWEREWQGETVWETGWSVLPEFQGRGIASRAIGLAIERMREEERHRSVHAYPQVDNAPSNAISRKAGFTLLGESDFEFPPGQWMRCNDWALDLSPAREHSVPHMEDNV